MDEEGTLPFVSFAMAIGKGKGSAVVIENVWVINGVRHGGNTQMSEGRTTLKSLHLPKVA
jgi:hypothetical protein